MAVPQGRDAALLTFSGQDFASGSNNLLRLRANNLIGALGDGHGALGILPQCKTGHAERGSLFLDATGVREDKRCAAQKTEKIEIADRRHDAQLRMMAFAGGGEPLLGAWMHRENHGNLGSDRVNGAEEAAERFDGINVGRPMESQNGEAAPAGRVLQA